MKISFTIMSFRLFCLCSLSSDLLCSSSWYVLVRTGMMTMSSLCQTKASHGIRVVCFILCIIATTVLKWL